MQGRELALFLTGAAVGAGALYFARRSLAQFSKPTHVFIKHDQVDAAALPNKEFDLADFENDEVVSEHLTRNIQFFGPESQKRIAGSFVVVIGLGVRECIYGGKSAEAITYVGCCIDHLWDSTPLLCHAQEDYRT